MASAAVPETWILVPEAARIAGVTPRYIRHAAARGLVVSRRLGARTLQITAESARAYRTARKAAIRRHTKVGRILGETALE